MLACLTSKLDPPIDYAGQSLVSKFMYLIFGVGYTIALITGVMLDNLVYTLYIGIATVVVSFIIVVPSWGFYRRNPLKFRQPVKAKQE